MIKGIELKFSLEYWELLTHGTLLKKTSLGLDEALQEPLFTCQKYLLFKGSQTKKELDPLTSFMPLAYF